MIREKLSHALKSSDHETDRRRSCTLRLIWAAVKDRDMNARSGGGDGIADEEITALLAKMVQQREESAASYEQDGRLALAEEERQEIAIISEFLPAKLDDASMQAACRKVVDDVEARGLRDVGKCMSVLKQRYAGQIDSAEASRVVKGILKQPAT